jgi:flagellar hook assembly protein FlgD
VATLVDGERAAGTHAVVWQGKDHRGEPVSSGVYFARLTTSEGTRAVRLVLVK